MLGPPEFPLVRGRPIHQEAIQRINGGRIKLGADRLFQGSKKLFHDPGQGRLVGLSILLAEPEAIRSQTQISGSLMVRFRDMGRHQDHLCA